MPVGVGVGVAVKVGVAVGVRVGVLVGVGVETFTTTSSKFAVPAPWRRTRVSTLVVDACSTIDFVYCVQPRLAVCAPTTVVVPPGCSTSTIWADAPADSPAVLIHPLAV